MFDTYFLRISPGRPSGRPDQSSGAWSESKPELGRSLGCFHGAPLPLGFGLQGAGFGVQGTSFSRV